MAWAPAAMQLGGAVIGAAAGGKGSSTPKAPKWLRQSNRQLGQFGQQLGQRPYEAYMGERVAPFSQDTLNAFNLIRQNVGAATPSYQNALNTAQNLTGFNAQQVNPAQWAGRDMSQYMNPYTQQVIDANLADQQNAYGQQYNQLASQAQAAGAFGGSRFGVAQGQLAADSVRNQALLSAQLRSQGFDTAAQLMNQDVDRMNWASGLNQQAGLASAALRGQAAQTQGSLAGQYQQSLAQDAQGLAGAGSAQQALAQQQLDVGYGDYMDRTRTYPTQQLNWWSGALQPGIATYGATAGAQQPQGGGLLGALGGAQVGSTLGSSVYDWWKGMGSGLNPIGNGGFTAQQVAAAASQIPKWQFPG